MTTIHLAATKALAIIFFLFVVSGCALRHQEEIRRLQEVSKEMDAQHKQVLEANQKFKDLLAIVHDNSIGQMKTAQDFLERFGEPVLIKTIHDESMGQGARWLYRYIDQMWGPEKVYLYFDPQGHFYRWEYQKKSLP